MNFRDYDGPQYGTKTTAGLTGAGLAGALGQDFAPRLESREIAGLKADRDVAGIESEYNSYSNLMDAASNAVSELEERLRPILKPRPSLGSSPKPAVAVTSPFAGALADQNGRLDALIARLRDLTQCVDF